MSSRLLIGALVMVCLSVPAVSPAQGGGVQDGVKLGKVYVSGENPVILLYDKPGGTQLAAASFWRVVWSPVGQGHVCYITTGNGASAGDLRIAITDNPKLVEFLTNEILGTFDKSYHDRPFTVHRGTISKSGDALEQWKEVCKSDRYTVEMSWRDFYPAFQLDTPVGGPRNPFGVTSLFVPARTGEVLINGRKAPGNVYPQMRGPAQSSTAFLAFSESWIK